MNAIDIAKKVKWQEVYRALRYFYPGHNWHELKEVFDRLRAYEPMEFEKGITLSVSGGIYPDLMPDALNDPDMWGGYDISIKKPGEVAHWSMSFNRWRYLASIPFELESVHRFPPHELLAHFLYEITWYGPEQETMKIGRGIIKKAHDAMRDLKKKE